MARVTYVKAARQRYATVPVINPETGQQKVTAVMAKRSDGPTPKTTKRGKPVVMRVTAEDRSKPLPSEKCGKCGRDIEVGQPYKHISPRSGPYGGRRLVRCATCPEWHVWEYSSSLSARLAEVSYNFEQAISETTSEEDADSALTDAADAVRGIAEEKRESAQSIEDGFQHATSQSDELNEIADSLDSWADDIENATVPDFPEPEEEDCETCEGSGKVDDPANETNGDGEEAEQIDCEKCEGSGKITPDEPTNDQIDEWREEVRNESGVDDSPV